MLGVDLCYKNPKKCKVVIVLCSLSHFTKTVYISWFNKMRDGVINWNKLCCRCRWAGNMETLWMSRPKPIHSWSPINLWVRRYVHISAHTAEKAGHPCWRMAPWQLESISDEASVAGSTKGANAPLGFCVRCWVKNERWRPNILCKINSKTPTKVARKYARVEPQTNKFIHYQRWTDTHTYVLKTLWGGLLRRQEKSHIISNDFTRTFLSEVWKEIHVCLFDFCVNVFTFC